MKSLVTDFENGWTYDKETNTIRVSEKLVPFATEYELCHDETKCGGEVVKFSHSTGPEFDPNTRWVYKSDSGLTLEVCNDAEMTKLAAKRYLEAKTGIVEKDPNDERDMERENDDARFAEKLNDYFEQEP